LGSSSVYDGIIWIDKLMCESFLKIQKWAAGGMATPCRNIWKYGWGITLSLPWATLGIIIQ
jgi:hypothetical protein